MLKHFTKYASIKILALVGLFTLLSALLSMGIAQERDAAFYGLEEGKPYDGTELNFLICCETAPQFASLANRSNEEFTDLTGISVTWAGGPFGNFKDKLIVEATSGSGNFDIAAWVDAYGPEIRPFLLPLNDLLEEANIDTTDFPGAYQAATMVGTTDTTYGMPLRGHPFILMYRQDVFDDLGLSAPTTWQEVKEVGDVIREKTDLTPISMYYGINAGQNLFNWESMLWSNGGDIFDEDMKPIFNNAAGVEATEFYASLLQDGYTSPGAVAFNEQEANQEIVQGRAAMFTGWWWMWSRLQNAESAAAEVVEGAAFAPAPGWAGGTTATYGHIWPVGILEQSRNQEAAWEYLKWLTHKQTGLDVVLDKSDPKYSTNVAVRSSVLSDPEVNALSGGLQQTAADILATSRTQPLIPEWLEVQSVLEIAINEIAGGADVQELLDDAAAEIEDIMSAAGYY